MRVVTKAQRDNIVRYGEKGEPCVYPRENPALGAWRDGSAAQRIAVLTED